MIFMIKKIYQKKKKQEKNTKNPPKNLPDKPAYFPFMHEGWEELKILWLSKALNPLNNQIF